MATLTVKASDSEILAAGVIIDEDADLAVVVYSKGLDTFCWVISRKDLRKTLSATVLTPISDVFGYPAYHFIGNINSLVAELKKHGFDEIKLI